MEKIKVYKAEARIDDDRKIVFITASDIKFAIAKFEENYQTAPDSVEKISRECDVI